MNEEVNFYLDAAKEKMVSALNFLDSELGKIRAGKADIRLIDGISVDYYGTPTPLANVSNISTPDAMTIAIQPWEKKMIAPIMKAIMIANIGITPVDNGELIRLSIPVLTEERRKDLSKQAKAECEHAKVGIRNARRDTNDEIKKLQKDGLSEDMAKDAEAEVQKITDGYISKIDDLYTQKDNYIIVKLNIIKSSAMQGIFCLCILHLTSLLFVILPLV